MIDPYGSGFISFKPEKVLYILDVVAHGLIGLLRIPLLDGLKYSGVLGVDGIDVIAVFVQMA